MDKRIVTPFSKDYFGSRCGRHIWCLILLLHNLISDSSCACQPASILGHPSVCTMGKWSSHDGKDGGYTRAQKHGILTKTSYHLGGNLIISDLSTMEDGVICS